METATEQKDKAQRICMMMELIDEMRELNKDMETCQGSCPILPVTHYLGMDASFGRLYAILESELGCIEAPEEEYAALSAEGTPSGVPHGSYICRHCAEGNGGTRPEDHVATFHTGKCDMCGDEHSLCSAGDYDWPDGERKGMRD